MPQPVIEHVNLTVSDNRRSARLFADLFGWHVRWEGLAQSGGHSIHVGDDSGYFALYAPPQSDGIAMTRAKGTPLNHVGILVDDLDVIWTRVVAAGLSPFGREAYDPGERFYFLDWDGIEFEVVSYG